MKPERCEAICKAYWAIQKSTRLPCYENSFLEIYAIQLLACDCMTDDGRPLAMKVESCQSTGLGA